MTGPNGHASASGREVGARRPRVAGAGAIRVRGPGTALAALVAVAVLVLALACNGAGPTPAPTQPLARPTATAQAASQPSPDEPVGFPVATTLRPLKVVETPQGKVLTQPAANSPTVLDVARDIQTRPSNDFEANAYGWNCRVHDKHEGAPAVDWYLPNGTPVIATMRGQAELYLITTSNAFEYYGVDPRLTLGLPSPSTPLYPLPGPGGGMGVFVSILNGNLRAEYGHLDLDKTLAIVPATAFVAPFTKAMDYRARFSRPISHEQVTLVASWRVERGDVVGFVGNTGYSDVDHLHYQVVTSDRRSKFCPTEEPLPNSGWLFRRPTSFP